MIINNRKDLEAAPDNVRERFIEQLAGGINHWQWQNSEWILVQDTTTISKFGFTPADFPDAPVPEKPTHNPDERALEQEIEEARAKRDALLAESDWVTIRATDTGNSVPDDWQTYRQALRDITEQTDFPENIDWPEKPE